MVPLQVFGGSYGIGGLVIAIIVPVLIVAFGTYVGVLVALQSFFEASSWQEASRADED
jgi:fumarate reductase subunit D